MPLLNKTVQDFFQEANWQGLSLVQNENTTASSTSTPVAKLINVHLGLTVKEYFTCNNWQGTFISGTDSHGQQIQAHENQVYNITYSLKMPVGEFFQRMVWKERKKSQVQIASSPSTPTSKASNSQATQQLSLQDLSDLM